MLDTSKRFSKEICKHLSSWNLDKIYGGLLDTFTNKMMFNINVLQTFVMASISSKVATTLVVIRQNCDIGRIAKIAKQRTPLNVIPRCI